MSNPKKYFEPVNLHINFPEMEEKILKTWYENGIVSKYLHKNDSSEKYFSFQDGPITANNPMGVHHGWGRTYKDLWQKYKTMQGYKQRYQNGFDCQGLWVEVEVEKELGLKTKKDIENLVPGNKKASIEKFVNLCKERVLKYSGIQTEQTKRLGNFMDWENSYFTMSDENNYMIWHFLKVCHEKGWIYKGKDSVPWCPRCETAISQHEMLTEDYKEVTHDSIYFSLPLVGRENEYLLVWTTTPWTLIANIAVAVDADLEYSLIETDSKKYWLVKDLVETVFKGKTYNEIKTVKGKELEGLKYNWAFDDLPRVKKTINDNVDKFHTVILTDKMIMPISVTEGTGMVHTAVSAGIEDFRLGKKLGLPMIEIIDDQANYLDDLEEFSGQNAKKHPEIIFDYLKKLESEKDGNWIFAIVPYKHRYPACWRCKTELVWKVAEEWYITMDKVDPTDEKKRTLRQEMIDVAKKIKWIPDFGLDRELDWLSNMHDWLISKPNRYWGLALPIYECNKCGYFDVIGGRDELEDRAVEGWDEFDGNSPHKPWIDAVKIKCAKCDERISRLPHVGNVWLDAGIVPYSTISSDNKSKPLYLTNKEEWKKWFPVDFITESFPGQFKNWFYSMIAMSTVLENVNPFKTVLGYATALAEDGRAMHKSWGNSIEFNEGAEKIGVDVMRWMYVRQNPADNLLFGYKTGDEVRRQFHLKLWNVYNYFVTYASLDDWQPIKNSDSKNILDNWILARLKETVKAVTDSFDKYEPSKASVACESFVDDLSNWYIRRSRTRTGNQSQSGEDKNYFYATTYHVLEVLSRLIAPITPFMSDVIYKNLTHFESVHLAEWPETEKLTEDEEKIVSDMTILRDIVEKAHAIRKEKQLPVRQPLAKVSVNGISEPLFEGLAELLKDEINVKDVEIKPGKEFLIILDTNISAELASEGRMRDIIRQIQDERKKLGTKLDEYIDVVLPEWPKQFEEDIKKKTLIKSLSEGEFSVKRLS